MNFVFLDRRPSYDILALRSGSMGGVQTGTILLAEALAKRGHDVTIYNDRDSELRANGVFYAPVSAVKDNGQGKIVVSNNSVNIFHLMEKAVCVLWARNNIVWNRMKNEEKALSSLLKFRPNIVFPSRHAARTTSFIYPFRSRNIIQHGVDTDFANGARDAAPPPVAIFASQPSRNLKRVLKAWKEIIHPALPTAKLHIYYPKQHLYPKHLEGMESIGIEIKGSVSKQALAQAMHEARIMLYPGHRTETFCNAAAESLCAGLPVVTMGIGALKERVRHGVDGYVSWTTSQMGRDALKVLTDDDLWLRMHRAAMDGTQDKTWKVRAAEWEKAAQRWAR